MGRKGFKNIQKRKEENLGRKEEYPFDQEGVSLVTTQPSVPPVDTIQPGFFVFARYHPDMFSSEPDLFVNLRISWNAKPAV